LFNLTIVLYIIGSDRQVIGGTGYSIAEPIWQQWASKG